MVFVMFWKMLRCQSKKCFADVCLYVVTKRRVVPDNVSLSDSSGILRAISNCLSTSSAG